MPRLGGISGGTSDEESMASRRLSQNIDNPPSFADPIAHRGGEIGETRRWEGSWAGSTPDPHPMSSVRASNTVTGVGM